MKIIHNPRCRKSRETLEIIRNNGLEPEIVEYLNQPLSADEIKEIVNLLGVSPVELIRKGEDVFKTNFKGKTLSDEQWIQAMAEYPKLIERPIVIKGKKAVIGRPPENVKSLL